MSRWAPLLHSSVTHGQLYCFNTIPRVAYRVRQLDCTVVVLPTFILVVINTPGLMTFFCKSFSPSLPFLLQHWLHGFPGLFTDTFEHFLVFLFFHFYLLVSCGGLSWLVLAFERTLKYHLVSYRIVLSLASRRTAVWYVWISVGIS